MKMFAGHEKMIVGSLSVTSSEGVGWGKAGQGQVGGLADRQAPAASLVLSLSVRLDAALCSETIAFVTILPCFTIQKVAIKLDSLESVIYVTLICISC